MRMSKLCVVMGLLILVGGAHGNVTAQSANPIAGTWELNVAKSRLTPGGVPRSETRTYTVTGQQVHAVHKGIGPDGKPTLQNFTVTYDGKEYPYSGSTLYDTIALTRVDDHTVTFFQKKSGKVTLTGKRVISKDGKTLTVSGKGTDVTGQPTDVFLVFEKR